MTSKSLIFAAVLVLLMVAGVFSMRKTSSETKESQESRMAPTYGQVEDFEFTNQSGEAVRAKDLKGKIWIANFIFTSCGGPCPIMTSKMRRLQKDIDHDKVMFVSISVDPTHDTPEVLAAYAKKFEADTGRWHFLTGDLPDIIALARNVFKVSVGEDPDLHTTRFILVDGKGRIRGYPDSQAEGFVDHVVGEVNELLREAQSNKTASL